MSINDYLYFWQKEQERLAGNPAGIKARPHVPGFPAPAPPAPAPTPPAPAPSGPTLQNRLVAVGDSQTDQAFLSSPLRWSTIRAAELGIPVLNNGVSGSVVQNRADSGGSPRPNNLRARHVSALMGAQLSERYEFLPAFNDMRYTAAPATMNYANAMTDLEFVIDALLTAGVPVSGITIGSLVWGRDALYTTGSAGFTGSSRTIHEQYCAGIYDICYRKGLKYAPVYERMRDNGGTSLIDADNVHANSAGSAQIALAMAEAYVPTSATWTGGTPAAPAPTPSPPPPAPTPPAPAPAPGVSPITVVESTTSPVMSGNSTTEVYTSNPTGGIARVGTFVVGTEATFEIQHPNTTDSGAVLAFDVATGLPSTTNTQDYIAQIIPSGAVYQASNANTALVTPNFTLPAGSQARMRLRCATDGVVTMETKNDDASQWVVRYTYPTTAVAGTTMHVRMYCVWSASQRRIYQPRVSGVVTT